MALSDEETKRLISQADGLAQKGGSIFRALVKLTEAEVRKQDEELIRQMLEVIECQNGVRDQEELAAITAARAWLDGAAPQQAAPAERKQLRTVTYICPVCAASLERRE